jgi:hypothetical protein
VSVVVPKLRIDAPTEETLPGRGFYQLEEDALYVQVARFEKGLRFFSYLESESVRFDLDRHGKLLFIEVDRARRHWEVEPSFAPPELAVHADIRWLDFREQLAEPRLLTDERRQRLLLRFTSNPPRGTFYLAENVIVQIDAGDYLSSIWVTDIDDDLAGREIAAFRKQIRGDDAQLAAG